MSRNNCFVCTGEIQNRISESDNSSSEKNSYLLCKILELPDLGGNETKELGGKRISYCRVCLNKLLNILDMLEELERLEKKILDEKYSIELQLKEKEKSHDGQNSTETHQLRGQIVTELRGASIGSMLDKIRNKRVGQRRNSKGHVRILKGVPTPDILDKTIQTISHAQLQTTNVGFSSQECGSQSQLVNQNSFLSNPQSNFMRNDQLESQVEEETDEETLTVNMTVTHWASENEECDIKYEIGSDSDMAIDPLQPGMDHLDFPQQNEFIGQISTKLDVDDLPGLTQLSDAQQTSTKTEDLPRNNNFICGTSGAGFLSYDQLKIHDRMHMQRANVNSTVRNIRQKKGNSHHNTTKDIPCLRPRKCEECGKILASAGAWRNHVQSFHRGEFKCKCTLCNYGSQRPSDLRRHIAGVHSVKNVDLKCSLY